MNQIKKGRDLGGFTRSSDEGKPRYELIPKELYDILERPIDGFSRWEMKQDLNKQSYKFRFKDFDPLRLAEALICYKYPHNDAYHKVLKGMAELYTKGAEVHGDNNWKLGTNIKALQSFKESYFRHFISMECGEIGEDHFSACLFNLLGANYCITKLNE